MIKKLLFRLFVCLLLASPAAVAAQKATLEQMIGQMVMVGIPDTLAPVSAAIRETLRQGKAGGIILFEKNLCKDSTAARLKNLTADLQSAPPLPLLIAIDQEGGKVNRLKPRYGFPETQTASYLGALHHNDSSKYYATITAETLHSLGINLNFAPVVDLCSNPENPVIAKKERCYGSDPGLVTRQARIFIRAHQKKGVLTVLKHFPGHGSSGTDTHQELTDVTQTWKPNELIPYAELIRDHKAEGVMSAHIVHCSLDTTCLPATLSHRIITGVLRDSLGYAGVVFSDDMQMKAISSYYGLDSAVFLAITAGVDILVVANNVKGSTDHQASELHQMIVDMVASGRIPESRIRESYLRIVAMKRKVYQEFSWPL
ncbi:MAG TPA: glycoside hydrolase family 3 protein [Bacteroidales bacterium]|nr:glycoside hydrolase family 3 protein [Bacteroidales bacterium]HRZ48096.1 glycoside hydrolase family 3 protein [Bacteroidales bacterium]